MSYPSYEQIQDTRRELLHQLLTHYVHHDLFSFNWWVLLILAVVPWVVLWKFVNRKRVFELYLYGMFIVFLSMLADAVGVFMLWWGYKDELLPLTPQLLPANFSVVGVTFTLVYQYFSTWKSFVLANTVVAFAFSFLAEPLLTWLGIYDPMNWKPLYSFLIYIAMTSWCRWCILVLRENQRRAVSGS